MAEEWMIAKEVAWQGVTGGGMDRERFRVLGSKVGKWVLVWVKSYGGPASNYLDHEKVEMLPKLPPVLRRKLEEIRKHRRGATLSKKQLLKEGCLDFDRASANTSDRRDQPDHDDSIRSAKVAPEPTEPHEIFSDKDNHNAEDNKKDLQKEDEEIEDEVEEVEEYRRFSCVEGNHTRPRSPSFRFYVSGSLHVKEDDNGENIKLVMN
ncbi:hypothetical protein DITRI_Ditri07aG0042700 [Diplodiscus trichospermus]